MPRFRAPSEPKAPSSQLLETFEWPAKPTEPSSLQLLPPAELEDPASPGFAARLVEQRKAASMPPSEQVEQQRTSLEAVRDELSALTLDHAAQDESESEDSAMDPAFTGRRAFEMERSTPPRRPLASKSETALPLPAAPSRRPRPDPIFTSQPLRPVPQAVQTPFSSRLRRSASFAQPATPSALSSPPSAFSTSPPRLPPLPHLPALGEDYTGPTSYANWTVANEAEVELAKIAASAASVEDVLKDADAGRDFLHFCASLPGNRALPAASLCSDLLAFSALGQTFQSTSNALASTYLQATSPLRLNLPLASRAAILEACMKASQEGSDLSQPIEGLKRELEPYLRLWLEDRVIKSMQERLGRWRTGFGWSGMGHCLGDLATDGLGESFCLTDWTKQDNPIVLVSDGFGAVTGFPCADIIGRNCRFLQGPGTSPDSIEPLREALKKGEAVTKLVLNYRSDGHPFFNLINVTPLKGSDGRVKFFLGGQTDATLTMQEVGVAPSAVALPPTPGSPAQMSSSPPFSPYMQAQLQSMQQAATSRLRPPASSAPQLPPSPPESPAFPGRAYSQSAEAYGASSPRLAASSSSSPKPRRFGFFGRKKRRRETTETTQSTFEGRSTAFDVSGSPDVDEPEVWMRRDSLPASPSQGGKGWQAGGGGVVEQVGQPEPYEPKHTYSRIALVDRPSGKILFASAPFVDFLTSSRSSIVHHHLTNFLTSPVVFEPGSTVENEKDQTRRLRRNVTLAIEGGHVYRTLAAVEVEKKGKGLARLRNEDERHFKTAVLHLVPLLNRNEQVEKLVAMCAAALTCPSKLS
ncbi:hypothetical protein JCM10296v2_005467 [Rhodotorula toruloides]